MIESENASPNGWTFVDIQGVYAGTYVQRAQPLLAERIELLPGYSITWSGQYECMVRAKECLQLVIPLTLAVIALLLYLDSPNLAKALWALSYDLSVAVRFMSLAGEAGESGMVTLLYLARANAERALIRILCENLK